METKKADQTSARKRTRSPNYPTTNLQDALDKAKIVWRADGRNEVPVASLADHWGYKPKSSSTLQLSAAIKQFGLFLDVPDKNACVKLSDLAIRILSDENPNSAERSELIKRAALSPRIFSEIWNKYQGSPPSDTTVKTYLIADLKFNPDVVDKLIGDFRATISFASLSPSDKFQIGEDNESSAKTSAFPPVTGDSNVSNVLRHVEAVFNASKVSPAIREFIMPLPTGVLASIKVPFPMSLKEFEAFKKLIDAFQDGLVQPNPGS